MMQLWLVKRKEEDLPSYEEVHAVVVCADGPESARKLVSDEHCDEPAASWLSPNRSTCTLLGTADRTVAQRGPHVVLIDRLNG